MPVATNFWGTVNGLCRYLFRGQSQHHPVPGKCDLSDYPKRFWNVKRGSAYNMTSQSLYHEGSYEQIISKAQFRNDSVWVANVNDCRIKTAFGYVSSSRPDAPSLLRQIAYQQFLPVPGPLSDPEGWKTLRPVAIRGTMFCVHRAEAKATVRISCPFNPVKYLNSMNCISVVVG